MHYSITVNVELADGVEFDDLHYDDMQDDPTGEHDFSIRADNDDDAMEAAIYEFHGCVPVRVIEDFEIDAIITRRGR